MSGHIFFNDSWYGFDDAIYSALRLIEVLAKKDKSSHKVFKEYPSFHSTPEINIEVPENKKFKIISIHTLKKRKITWLFGSKFFS